MRAGDCFTQMFWIEESIIRLIQDLTAGKKELQAEHIIFRSVCWNHDKHNDILYALLQKLLKIDHHHHHWHNSPL